MLSFCQQILDRITADGVITFYERVVMIFYTAIELCHF